MRRRKGGFIRKGTAILLSAVLTTALVMESGLTSVGKVYAEETKVGDEPPVDQSTDSETPAQREEQPDVPAEPETPPQGEEQPEVSEEPETPPQGEEQPEVPEEPETLPQETVPEIETYAMRDIAPSGQGWTLSEDGTLTLTSDMSISWWYAHNRPYIESVKRIVIEEGVTYICREAFQNCVNVTEVSIPSTVTMIGMAAFDGCSSLEDVTLPTGITEIYTNTFRECSSLRKINLPHGVTSIEMGAFRDCSSLEEVTIPDSVTQIGEQAFFGCSSFQEVTIPGSVASIGRSAFCECTALREATISDGVTEVGADMFGHCENLVKVTIPASVTSIGNEAFVFCSSLQEVTIPAAVTEIGGQAFNYCSALRQVNMLSAVPPVLVAYDNYDNPLTFENCGLYRGGIYVPHGTADAYRTQWAIYQMYIREKAEEGGGDVPGDDKEVSVDVAIAPGAPGTSVITPAKEELIEFLTPLLTDEEKRQLEAGADVKLVLSVQDAGSAVSDADKAAVTAALDGSVVGQYLDITLKKAVGTAETQLTETDKKIKLTIDIPGNLKNTDTEKTRTYSVIRVHNGAAAVLNDLDASADTVTIETDRFSTYAIVYKDVANGSGSGDGGNTGTGGGTGDSGNTGTGGGSGNSATGSSGSDHAGNNSGTNSGNGGIEAGGGSDSGSTGSGSSGSSGSAENGNRSETVIKNSAAGSNGADSASGTSGGNEPKTGDNTFVDLYATAAMIVGFIYLFLYFADRARGMTEHEKDVFVAAFIRWAKKGGMFRKLCAFVAIFVLLAYYHSIGKRTDAEWREIYGA